MRVRKKNGNWPVFNRNPPNHVYVTLTLLKLNMILTSKKTTGTFLISIKREDLYLYIYFYQN